ncbi:peptide deformylase [Dongshaea marina]|uniref:peptide deformylase n=1 Tax=Dongshaea marina TaxID=2047966 RepID=UPI000D3EC0AA|nr:peptide deformylase [Dongshaea marina]
MSQPAIAQLGATVLSQPAEPVTDIYHGDTRKLIQEMLDTVKQANGVGIAAPQLFAPWRIIVIASSPNPRYPDAPQMEPMVMINPKILWRSDSIEKGWEGCLSVAKKRGLVPRHTSIEVSWLTEDGHSRHQKFSGFVARVIQHECDHLDGKTFIDRIESPDELIDESEYMARQATETNPLT